MPHWNIFVINFVCPFPSRSRWGQMGHDLVPEEIEIDPFGSRSSLRTAEHTAVKGARLVQVVNREGQVETRSVRHGLQSGNGGSVGC